jgi:hypothetical protein
MTRKIKIFVLLAVMALVVQAPAAGVTKTGTTAAKFLSMSIGPRAIGMGSAFTAISNDATAMYWNPAGLALLSENQFILSQTAMIADIRNNYIGLAIPMGETGTFGVNLTAVTMSDEEVTTEFSPNGTGETYSAGMYAFGLTYARQLYENFSIGFNLKYVREDIANSSAQGVALDIGTLFTTPFWGVVFSSSITNFGTKMQMQGSDLQTQYDPDPLSEGNNERLDVFYSTETFELPLRLQIGLARSFQIMEGQSFTLAVDAAHPNDNTEFVNVGGELALLNNMVFLRGGYKNLFMQDQEEDLSLGAGVRYDELGFLKISVDYAFQNYKHLGDVHTFGFLLRF